MVWRPVRRRSLTSAGSRPSAASGRASRALAELPGAAIAASSDPNRASAAAAPLVSAMPTRAVIRRSAARSTSRPIRIVRRTVAAPYLATPSRAFLAASPCARRPSAPPPTSSAARRRDPRSRESRHLSRRPPGRGRRGSQAPARVASIPPPAIPASATRSRRPTTGARRPRSGARPARARETGARANNNE